MTARRGFNTIIFGACLDGLFTAECTTNTLSVLDSLGRYGVFGLVGAQFDSGPSALAASSTGGPPRDGLAAFITNVRDHPALLGYYVFDDCCRESDADTRALYTELKALDPFHILQAPLSGARDKAWRYQAASGPTRGGTPAFDVFTFEHYQLPGVGGGVTTSLQLQAYPLDFAPCWIMGETSGQRDGHFPAESPAQTTVQDWVAFIGGGVRGQLWFDLSYSVNDGVLEAASQVGTQLAQLAGGILAPVAVKQPTAMSSTDGGK